ncbi:hypothetical protein HK104_005447 [Borealophlyctis nickersoniae]|nr:hypothetical protein HK104_005447 [Borealophlyctis nickersoniae]
MPLSLTIPDDLLLSILAHLPIPTILQSRAISRQWSRAASSPHVWRHTPLIISSTGLVLDHKLASPFQAHNIPPTAISALCEYISTLVVMPWDHPRGLCPLDEWFRQLPRLTRVDISNVDTLTDDSLFIILQTSRATVKYLNASGCTRLTAQCLSPTWIGALPALSHLDMSRTQCVLPDGSNMVEFIREAGGRLRRLGISKCFHMSRRGWGGIMQAIGECCVELEMLDVKGNWTLGEDHLLQLGSARAKLDKAKLEGGRGGEMAVLAVDIRGCERVETVEEATSVQRMKEAHIAILHNAVMADRSEDAVREYLRFLCSHS